MTIESHPVSGTSALKAPAAEQPQLGLERGKYK
jgi:hypothetical protein